VEKMTGMSAAQMTRLIGAFLDQGVVRAAPYQGHHLKSRYTAEDIALLAEVDRAHERLSGPAMRRVPAAGVQQHGAKRYEWLAKISVAHPDNFASQRAV
jgi:hypothetical protein